jgi:hypothetical protein
MAKDDDFLATLDLAAKLLLESASLSDSVEGAAPKPAVSLAERVKAFECVMDWAKTRRDFKPPEKKTSAFDGIKQQFHGTASKSRRGRVKSDSPAEGGDAPAEPATGADFFAGEA